MDADERFDIRGMNAPSSTQANGSGALDPEMELWLETITREQEKVKLPSGPTEPPPTPPE